MAYGIRMGRLQICAPFLEHLAQSGNLPLSHKENTMNTPPFQKCTECLSASRRNFIQVTGSMALSAALATRGWTAVGKSPVAENKVTELYQLLSNDQRRGICFPVDHELRGHMTLNKLITEVKIESFPQKQQALIDEVIRGLTSEEGYQRLSRQMKEDADGLGGYSVSFFGEPGDNAFECVLSGRHVTLRADGNFEDKMAFGGTMFYGHVSEAAGGFHEDETHKGNVFWYQAEHANKVFHALDPAQRKQALLGKVPHEREVEHRKGPYPGLKVGDMSSDQQELVRAVIMSMLRLYRKQDVDEALKIIEANGGIQELSLSFYNLTQKGKPGDIGDDGVWDLWRLEGPGFAWHYRGNPHPHGWVNIAKV